MIGLIVILLLVLFLPFTVHVVEKNLEVFLFVMGILAATVSGVLDSSLFVKALEDPVKITMAVLAAGLLFKWFKTPLENGIKKMSRAIPFPIFAAAVVIVLGLISSIITAIIAALILVLIVSSINLSRKSEVRFVVLACFSIGLGAVLTPIGEPLSTIAISKLGEDFFYLFELIGPEVISAVVIFGLIAAFLVKKDDSTDSLGNKQESESYREIIVRTVKIYLFVMGLTLLGAGFEPFINTYLIDMNPAVLYWINMISAVLDNATLAAAEVSPAMDEPTIQAILLGLIISGGMLIPGNIPNIIAAGKLGIQSKEWARFGLPIGLAAMVLYFVILFLI